MRILHTADFHAGRLLKGKDRTPEIAEALAEISSLAIEKEVDVVLVAGDLFETSNPSAEAQKVVFDFFLRLHEAQIPSVAISGNHDSAERLRSWESLLQLASVHMVTDPRNMIRRLETKSGERLVIGALPHLSERRLVKVADLLEGDTGTWRQKYREGMSFFLGLIEKAFEADSVNIVMAHTTLDGATPSGSERQHEFDLSNAYTVSGLRLPRGADYVALGHIHKNQPLLETPMTHYAGSIIQLDFGEAGEEKYINLVDITRGQRPDFQRHLLESGKELRTLRTDLEHLELHLEQQKKEHFTGHLKVVVNTGQKSAPSGLKDRVLHYLPHVLAVEVEKDEAVHTSFAPEHQRSHVELVELFARYWEDERGKGKLPDEIRQLFVDVEKLMHERAMQAEAMQEEEIEESASTKA